MKTCVWAESAAGIPSRRTDPLAPVLRRDSPSTYLYRSAFNTLRSCSFLATFVVLFQGLVCFRQHVYAALVAARVPSWLLAIAQHRIYYWFCGYVLSFLFQRDFAASPHSSTLTRFPPHPTRPNSFSTCLALFIEDPKRRRELAMYVLPRGLECMWSTLRQKSYVPFVPGGEVLLTRSVAPFTPLFSALGLEASG